ncbi:MAG: N-acetylmuramic acid 6-phosphate etherase [Candidatus Latescibacteria bacterium]|nr:N-acetylmuramic acid 6-phosphate etherase [Candidatus Latescibacterota bacterium]
MNGVSWADLLTEQRNPASEHIDELPTLGILALINREDAQVALAVERELTAIASAVELVVEAIRRGGRLFYLGAGTSGRLGILDAAECPPTYNTPPELVQALIAGGAHAVFQAVEGAEDRREQAALDLQERRLSRQDALVGIAASGVTPYVLGGIEYARRLGAATIFFTCSPSAACAVEADVKIAPRVGPEVITGSTRMKAGTATKLVLNMISTASMVRLGKTYGNLMVDLQPKNAKLRDRSCRILATLTTLAEAEASRVLASAGGDLKAALVMGLCKLEPEPARQLLSRCGGRVKEAVQRHRQLVLQ